MYSKRTNGNKLIPRPHVLEKISALNDLAVAEVVRLCLVQALPEADWKLGTLERSPAPQSQILWQSHARDALFHGGR
jgi:hypothetical protein